MFIRLFYFAVSIFVASVMTGCYEEIDLDKYRQEEGADLLTLNTILAGDSTIKVVATKTYFFSDRHSEYSFVPNLAMRMSVNDGEETVMDFDPVSNTYVSDRKAREGDLIRFSTRYNGHEVKAEDTVPHKVTIDSMKVTRQGPVNYYWNNDYIFTYYITFSEPPRQRNFYFLDFDGWGDGTYGGMEEKVFRYEFVFQQLASGISSSRPGWVPYSPKGLPFSDDGIDGTSHTLVLREIVQGNIMDYFQYWTVMHRKFWLYSISESYYRYLVSILCNDTYDDSFSGGMVNIGLVEPNAIFSNIIGGVGICGAYALDVKEMEVLETVGPFPRR